jgi:hypothetical protein
VYIYVCVYNMLFMNYAYQHELITNRGVNPELVLSYWPITRNRLQSFRLLKINNWLRNRVPRLTEGYLVTSCETGYPDWLLEKKNNNKTSLMKKKKKENFLNERKLEYIYI